jgi:hypothetical protein
MQMGRDFRFRGSLFAAGAAFLLIANAGCSGIGGPSADELLGGAVQTLTATAAANLAFQGTSQTSVSGYALPEAPAFEGRVTGGNKLVLRVQPEPGAAAPGAADAETVLTRGAGGAWAPGAADAAAAELAGQRLNPLPWLDRLPQLRRQAVLDASASDASVAVVRVSADPAQVRQLAAGELQRQGDRLQQRVQAELAAEPKGLGPVQAAARRSELQSIAAEGAARLQEMLASLQADGSFRFWIERSTRKPIRMEVETRLKYRSGGADREETGVTTYAFGDSGGTRLLQHPPQ